MKIKAKLLKLLISFALCIIIWTSSDGFTVINTYNESYDKIVSTVHNGTDQTDDIIIQGN